MAEIKTRPRYSTPTHETAQPQGFTRNIGMFTAIAFALACVGLASSGTLTYFSFQGFWPGADLVPMIAIGIGLSLIHGYTFSMMGTIAPRSAADYVIASRVIGAPIGFVASWGVMITGAVLAGAAMAFLSESLLPGLMTNLAFIAEANGIAAAAETLAQPQTVVVVGSVLTVLVFGLAILPRNFIQTVMKIGFFAGIAAWVLILAQLAFPSQSFSLGWDRWMGVQSYAERIPLATNLGMHIQPSADWLVYGGILIGFSIFFGNWITTYLAGEVKKPERTILVSSWASTLIAGGIFIGSALLLRNMAPAEWFSAESFLNQAQGFSGLTMPWVFFYSNVAGPNLVVSGFILLAFTLLIINLIQMQFQYASRIIVAWADDRMMPAEIGSIHPTLGSPIVAVLIVAVISVFSLLVSVLTGFVSNPMEYIFMLAVFQLPPSLAITILPFVRPTWFAQAPKIARIKIGPIPLISLTGLVTVIYLLAVTAISLVAPVGKGVGMLSLILFGFILVTGLLWYFLYHKRQLSRNVLVDEHFKSLTGE
jgi:amino acid transporter